MKNLTIGLGLLISVLYSCKQENNNINYLVPADKNIPTLVDNIEYSIGNWNVEAKNKPYSSSGNHRAVVKVNTWNQAVRVHIQWRRNDKNPQNKDIIIIDAATNKPVSNKHIREINNEYGDIIFQPNKGSDTYYFYYFPFQSTGGYYPVVSYIKPQNTAETNWKSKYASLSLSEFLELPEAIAAIIQSASQFDSFFPMEIIASRQETDSFFNTQPADYYIFPEYREYPARMKQYLPWFWIKRGLKNGISDKVQKGEYYSFQLCLFAHKSDLSGIQLSYYDLEGPGNSKITKENFQCINIDGVDLEGKTFKKEVIVKKGEVQPLWLGFMVPEGATPGVYKGKIIVKKPGSSSSYLP